MTAPTDTAEVTAAQWPAIGVTVRLVVTDPTTLAEARALLEQQLAELDLACSRFRPDSELRRLVAGRPQPVSALLAEAIGVALDAAAATDGAVDPTLGAVLSDLGYHDDFAALAADGPPVGIRVRTVQPAGWRRVRLDRAERSVEVPDGVQLDLGATAKALGADRAAAAIHAALGTGVLVSLGGDLAVAGPAPDGGWPVLVTDRAPEPAAGPALAAPDDVPAQTVALHGGGLATSGTAVRRWSRGGHWLHHLLDPSTGLPARTPWRTVTVAASSCVRANIVTTATMVRGEAGRDWLAATGLPARLVSQDGRVTLLGGWPQP
jgi:thiamine biosynthesis lipoprotein